LYQRNRDTCTGTRCLSAQL